MCLETELSDIRNGAATSVPASLAARQVVENAAANRVGECAQGEVQGSHRGVTSYSPIWVNKIARWRGINPPYKREQFLLFHCAADIAKAFGVW